MKLKKLVALITAGALCLGMSMTAFAADDKSPEKVPSANGFANGGDLAAVNQASEEEVQEIANKAMDWLKENKPNIAENAEVIFAGNYSLMQWDETNGWVDIKDGKVPGGKALFSFNVNDIEDKSGFAEGKVVYGLHDNGDGTYSLIEGKLVFDPTLGWSIQAEMEGFSPVTFFKVMSNGKIVEVDWKGDVVAPKTKTVARTTSPKTGE